MSIFLGTLFFLFGLVMGSFSNVVILRSRSVTPNLDKKLQTLNGRSVCFHCKKTLEWYELIPLFSFLIQGGKCRGCRRKISWQYPIVEALTAFGYLITGVLIARKFEYGLNNDGDLFKMFIALILAGFVITSIIILVTRYIKKALLR